MAKDYEVTWGWQSPSLNRWIGPGTEYLVPKLTDEEIEHAKAQGFIREVDLPAGIKSIREAQLQQDEKQQDAARQIQRDEAKRSARAVEEAQEASGRGPIARTPRNQSQGGTR
jgi:hypothetical protein